MTGPCKCVPWLEGQLSIQNHTQVLLGSYNSSHKGVDGNIRSCCRGDLLVGVELEVVAFTVRYQPVSDILFTHVAEGGKKHC